MNVRRNNREDELRRFAVSEKNTIRKTRLRYLVGCMLASYPNAIPYVNMLDC